MKGSAHDTLHRRGYTRQTSCLCLVIQHADGVQIFLLSNDRLFKMNVLDDWLMHCGSANVLHASLLVFEVAESTLDLYNYVIGTVSFSFSLLERMSPSPHYILQL
jgi:hypothetical protein